MARADRDDRRDDRGWSVASVHCLLVIYDTPVWPRSPCGGWCALLVGSSVHGFLYFLVFVNRCPPEERERVFPSLQVRLGPHVNTLSDSLGQSVPGLLRAPSIRLFVSLYLDDRVVPSRAPERKAAGEPGAPPGEDAERREEAQGAPRQAGHAREGKGEARHLSPTPTNLNRRMQSRRPRFELPHLHRVLPASPRRSVRAAAHATQTPRPQPCLPSKVKRDKFVGPPPTSRPAPVPRHSGKTPTARTQYPTLHSSRAAPYSRTYSRVTRLTHLLTHPR